MARERQNKNRRRNGVKGGGTPWHDGLLPETKRSILAVVFFALALVTLLAYWGRAGVFGSLLFRTLVFGLGKAYFLAPVTFVAVAFSFLLGARRKRIVASSLIGGAAFLVMGLAMIELWFSPKTGGWVGFAANWPFERAFDFWAAFVIEASLFLVAILVIANVPLWRPRQNAEEESDAATDADHETLPEAALPAPKPAGGKSPQEKPSALEGAPGAAASSPAPSSGQADEGFAVAKQRARRTDYSLPPLDLLSDDKGTPSSGDIRANANIIRRTLLNFGIDVEMGEVSVGPTVTQYTLKPAEGVKLARIVALSNDLSLALASHPIRIEAPIPGRSLVGIEMPNRSIALVGLRSMLENDAFQKSEAPLLFALGRDVAGAPVYANLTRMPHLLVAGATGSGKSVAVHSMITAFLYRNTPELLRFLIIDPKRVELASYHGIPHLLSPPITDGKKTISALRWAVGEMERRYERLADAGVRDIAGFNSRIAASERGSGPRQSLMPYLVIVIDELADLMAAYPREVEGSIIRLAQMARAVGIHLVVATQRPSVEVITGLIKANITSRLAFQVASQIDSRTILDVAGAEKLLGNGDMLFLAGDTAKPRRIQGGFVSEEEVGRIVEFIREQGETGSAETTEEDIFSADASSAFGEAMNGEDDFEGEEDPLYDAARETVIKAGKASASYLQRRHKIGYARAARLLDLLEERGVIGPGEGAKPREILARTEEPRA